jgi:hypothetical protein
VQFKTPQFIDIEDKIFGPFTLKQFIYLVGGAAMCYLSFKALPFIIGAPLGLAIAGLAAALAFYKVNNRPFFLHMQAWIKYMIGSKLYVWNKVIPKKKAPKAEEDIQETSYVPKLSDSKLKDISWSLDVLDTNKK